jgi:hypothetical protein
MKFRCIFPILCLAFLFAGCGGETELDDQTYARLTVDLMKAGFRGADADEVYQDYGVSPKQYEDYGKALEKDADRQLAVAGYLKDELGKDWAQWGEALGRGMAQMGLQMGVLAAEFGNVCVKAMNELIPALKEGIGELTTGLAEKLGELQKTIDENLEKVDEKVDEVNESLAGDKEKPKEETTEPPK